MASATDNKFRLVDPEQEKQLRKTIAQKKLMDDLNSNIQTGKVDLLQGAPLVDANGNIVSQSSTLPETPLKGKMSSTDYSDLLENLSSEDDLEFEDSSGDWSNKEKLQLGGAAASSAMIGANAQTNEQAIVAGVSAGLSTSALLAGSAAAGPAGIVVGLGVAALGMASAKKAKREAEKAERKRQAEQKRAEELRLLESYHTRRANAINQLAGAFRR